MMIKFREKEEDDDDDDGKRTIKEMRKRKQVGEKDGQMFSV